VQALKDYGTALACMRSSFIADPSQASKAETLCSVYLIMLSQVSLACSWSPSVRLCTLLHCSSQQWLTTPFQNFLTGHNEDGVIHFQGLLHILNNQTRETHDPFKSQMMDLASILAVRIQDWAA
jgi:hypothetical protein